MDRELLLEIGVEEMPASWLPGLTVQLAEKLRARLVEEGLTSKSPVEAFATPRRLTACQPELVDRQEDRDEDVMGPPVSAAFDAEGHPTNAGPRLARPCYEGRLRTSLSGLTISTRSSAGISPRRLPTAPRRAVQSPLPATPGRANRPSPLTSSAPAMKCCATTFACSASTRPGTHGQTSCCTSRPTRAPTSSSPATTSAAAPAASTRPGPCSTSACAA